MFDRVLHNPMLRGEFLPSPSRLLLSLLFFSLIPLLLPVQTYADTPGSTVNGKVPAQYIAETQGKSWAVIIGIDKYLNLAGLAYAVDDAKSVASMLGRQGFTVSSLYNTQATKKAILRELRQNLVTRVQKDDRVVVFFAGHIGETPSTGKQQPVGYMMPVDTEPGLLADTAISVDLLRELSEALPAKQVLFLIDICYGGIAGRNQRSFPPMTSSYLKMIASEPARQLITAGGTGQQALAGPKWKHSVFTYYLLEGIGKGRGDLNGDGIIPTSELFAFLDEHVQSAALTHKHAQRPEMWGLSSDKGEFVFIPENKSSNPQIANSPNRPGGTSNPAAGTVETIVGLLKSFGNPLDIFNNSVPSGKSEQADKQKMMAEEAAALEAEREKFELQALQSLKEQRQREKELQAQLAEAQRLAAEEERRRVAAEQARHEQETLLAQQQAALKAEQARVAAEEKQRQVALAQLAEAQRLAAEEERRRVAAEQARHEQEILLAQQQAALEAQQAKLAAEEERRKQLLAQKEREIQTQLAIAQRMVAEEERRRAEVEQARLAEEEERRKQALAERELTRQAQLAEARRMAEEQARVEAEEQRRKEALAQRELTRQAQLAEARRMAEEQRRQDALAKQEQTRQAQLAEAQRMAAEQARLKEEAALKVEKARLAAEEQQRQEAAEARRLAALEEERERVARLKEEAALNARKARLAAEEQQRQEAAEARRLAAQEEERRRVAAEKERKELEAKVAQPQIIPNGGNNQAATLPESSPSPGTVSAFTPPPTPSVIEPSSNESSGFFGFFENMFNKAPDSQPATSDQPIGSQPEAVLEARLHPQDLPGAVQSALSGTDDVPMILIPAGEFRMGSTEAQISGFLKDFEGIQFNAFQAEIPQRQVSLPAYYIDQYEVSYRYYRAFLESTGRDAPAFWENERFHKPDHPVLGVTWYDATAYCIWAGKRLPTEAEWEQASRGSQGYAYPWGNAWDPQRTNTASYWAGKTFLSMAKWSEWMQTALDRGKAGPLDVGTFSNGVSPFGVHDMAGNVSEWVFDWYAPYESQPTLIHNPNGADSGTMKVHRGGSWSVSSIFARSTYRARENPEKRSPYIGMRCAKSYQ